MYLWDVFNLTVSVKCINQQAAVYARSRCQIFIHSEADELQVINDFNLSLESLAMRQRVKFEKKMPYFILRSSNESWPMKKVISTVTLGIVDISYTQVFSIGLM